MVGLLLACVIPASRIQFSEHCQYLVINRPILYPLPQPHSLVNFPVQFLNGGPPPATSQVSMWTADETSKALRIWQAVPPEAEGDDVRIGSYIGRCAPKRLRREEVPVSELRLHIRDDFCERLQPRACSGDAVPHDVPSRLYGAIFPANTST